MCRVQTIMVRIMPDITVISSSTTRSNSAFLDCRHESNKSVFADDSTYQAEEQTVAQTFPSALTAVDSPWASGKELSSTHTMDSPWFRPPPADSPWGSVLALPSRPASKTSCSGAAVDSTWASSRELSTTHAMHSPWFRPPPADSPWGSILALPSRPSSSTSSITTVDSPWSSTTDVSRSSSPVLDSPWTSPVMSGISLSNNPNGPFVTITNIDPQTMQAIEDYLNSKSQQQRSEEQAVICMG